MPDHARQQIRYAFRDLLNGGPIWGNRVYTGRSTALSAKELPGLLVVAGSETVEVSSADAEGLKLDRIPEIVIVGYAAGRDVQDRLDAIALEVEQLVAAAAEDTTSDLLALIKDAVLTRTEIQFDTSVETESGVIRLVYAVGYRTTRTTPETAIQ